MIRKIIYMIIVLSLIGSLTACWRSVKYVKPATNAPHHGEESFISGANKKGSLWSYFKMRWREGGIESTPQRVIDEHSQVTDLTLINGPTTQPQVTWLGHATVLVQYDGVNFLTDPQLSNYASPIPHIGPKRLVRPALDFNQLPPIDFVLISHNHYDHLDNQTVKQIGNNSHWLVPLGLKQWLVRRDIDAKNITELDWWQQWSYKDKATITATPSQHWSKRTPFDTNKSLWASWHININGFKTWFAGDTGYNEAQFKRIGQQLGPHDLALIPIGAYGPRYFMLPMHVDPQQAVKSHIDIRSKFSVGIHWGTFELTHEPYLEPKLLLNEQVNQAQPEYPFVTMKIGQTLGLDKP